MSLFCQTESCRKRELTHLSQTPVWDLLFRGEACFQCPKYRPWKTIFTKNYYKPQGQGGAVGQAHPMKVPPALVGAQGHGHMKCSAQSCKLQLLHLVCWSPPLLGHLEGSCNASQTGIWHKTASLCQPGTLKKLQVKRCGNQRDLHGLGSHPTLALSASFLWHLVCRFVLRKSINR